MSPEQEPRCTDLGGRHHWDTAHSRCLDCEHEATEIADELYDWLGETEDNVDRMADQIEEMRSLLEDWQERYKVIEYVYDFLTSSPTEVRHIVTIAARFFSCFSACSILRENLLHGGSAVMEAEWFAQRAALRCLARHHPAWTQEALAPAVVRSRDLKAGSAPEMDEQGE